MVDYHFSHSLLFITKGRGPHPKGARAEGYPVKVGTGFARVGLFEETRVECEQRAAEVQGKGTGLGGREEEVAGKIELQISFFESIFDHL